MHKNIHATTRAGKTEGGLFFYPLKAFSIVLGMVAEVSIEINLVKSGEQGKNTTRLKRKGLVEYSA